MKFGFAKEDLRVLLDINFNMTQQHALIIMKTNQILVCIIVNVSSRSKKYYCSLFGT